MSRTIMHYFRTKKHVWITVVGMIIALRVYDQILRSTLVVVNIDPQQMEAAQYNPILQQQKRQQRKQQQKQQQKQQHVSSTTETSPGSIPSSPVKPLLTIERDPAYHVVFSTSCSLQQDWESYVFFYHCMRVRQPGNITRIVSGCNDVEAQKLIEFYQKYIVTMADISIQSFHIHFTPSYGSLYLSEGKYPYKYMNKPYGLRNWMENRLQLGWTNNNTTITSPFLSNNQQQQQHQELLDGIVILMDPDMVLFQPITHDFSGDNIIWAKEPENKKVTHGNPISQQDGYLSNEWMKFNFTYITGDPSIKPPPYSDGPIHWNTGPPYLATVSDMYKIVSLWTETAPRVLKVYPQLFAEMYGFVIATVMLRLPFQMIQSIVVSTTSATNREGWPFIDALNDADICHIPIRATSGSVASSETNPKLPIGLHYCGIYLLGKVRQCIYVLNSFAFFVMLNVDQVRTHFFDWPFYSFQRNVLPCV
jgi:peptidyl serine alpha-galactosyltransferase